MPFRGNLKPVAATLSQKMCRLQSKVPIFCALNRLRVAEFVPIEERERPGSVHDTLRYRYLCRQKEWPERFLASTRRFWPALHAHAS